MKIEEISSEEDKFLATETLRELANNLKIEYKILTYYLYRVKEEDKYLEFEIKKRNGGVRNIAAPIAGLKYIQSNLNEVLQKILPPKESIHGFVLKKNIVTNANLHLRKNILVNIDIKDFFPSINFGRVRGLFMAHPFKFNIEVATAIAQICCYKTVLPQGAPTSPIISNFICRRLDNQLIRFSIDNKLRYTRYADDISLSTNLKNLPVELGVIKDQKIIISSKIIDLFQQNGFEINSSKVRYAFKENRQEVTGLIVNKIVNVDRRYVRHVRAMLHSWEKFGITPAAYEHFSKYNYKNKIINVPETSFLNELVGKIGFIGFVKGKDDSVYKSLLRRIKLLAPEVKLKLIQNEVEQSLNPIIYGEGKTDWKHLKRALEVLKSKGLYPNLYLNFHEDYEENFGNSQLLEICRNVPKAGIKSNRLICVFDRDDHRINKIVVEGNNNYKHWGGSVYSLLLPKPEHRDFDEVCIEHYYSEEEMKMFDVHNRRIYSSDEFDKKDGTHKTEELRYKNISYLQAKYPRILDNNVLNKLNVNVALSKNNFSENILNQVAPFDKVSFDSFRIIFDEIEKIINI